MSERSALIAGLIAGKHSVERERDQIAGENARLRAELALAYERISNLEGWGPQSKPAPETHLG